MQKIPTKLKIPNTCGIYLFRDNENKIIYVGKAKKLKSRISSYFRKNVDRPKTAALVKKIANVEFIITDSEEEAIILESNMIKKHYPKYNLTLRDNSPTAYALITDEKFPRLMIVRKDRNGIIHGPKGKAYGPFMRGSSKGFLFGVLRKAFKIRTCSKMPKKLCLQHHIGNCTGPCEEKISEKKYKENIKQAEKILKDPKSIDKYLEKLQKQMKTASKNKEFEKAIKIRNAWRALSGLTNKMKIDELKDKDEDYIVIWEDNGFAKVQVWKMIHGVIRDREKYDFEYVEKDPLESFLSRYYEMNNIPKNIYVNKKIENLESLESHLLRIRTSAVHINLVPSRGNKKELIDLIEKNIILEKAGNADPALIRLQKELNLQKIPYVIECFDISNLGKEDVVASMVQLVNAVPKKSNYRKFKIRTVRGQDDFGSIKEVVFRRYRRIRDEGEPMPDIILIDGGIGQLHAAKNALDQLELNIPLFSLAKRNEEIYGLDFLEPLVLAKNNDALHVLQRARDEAHRFAIKYNRSLRKRRK